MAPPSPRVQLQERTFGHLVRKRNQPSKTGRTQDQRLPRPHRPLVTASGTLRGTWSCSGTGPDPARKGASRRTRPVKIPARAPLTKQAQATRVSPGPQVPLRGLAYEVGALGTQPGRANAALAEARTVDYSRARGSMQSVDAPSSMSERFVTDGRLRLSGRCDACPTVGDRRRKDAPSRSP